MPNRDFPPLKAWSVAKRTLGLDGAAMKTIQIEAFGNPAEVVRAVDVLQTGRDGHWGPSGMRGRAEKMGARLNVRSRAGAGIEVELTVPSHIAYQFQSSDGSL